MQVAGAGQRVDSQGQGWLQGPLTLCPHWEAFAVLANLLQLDPLQASVPTSTLGCSHQLCPDQQCHPAYPTVSPRLGQGLKVCRPPPTCCLCCQGQGPTWGRRLRCCMAGQLGSLRPQPPHPPKSELRELTLLPRRRRSGGQACLEGEEEEEGQRGTRPPPGRGRGSGPAVGSGRPRDCAAPPAPGGGEGREEEEQA